MKQSLWQKVAKTDKLHESNQKLQKILSCGKSNRILQTWFVPGLFICWRLASLKMNVLKFTVRIGITYVCSYFVDVQEANRSFSQKCRVWNCFARRRFTYGWITSSSIWWMCLGNNFERHTRERVTPSHSHSDNRVFESIDHVPPNIPNSSHSTQLYLFEDNAAVIQMIIEERSPNLRHVTRTHRVDSDRLFWESELGSFYCDKVPTTNRFTQAMTQPENVDQTWSQYASNVLESVCALDVHLIWEQLSNLVFQCTQDKRDLVAGMLYLQKLIFQLHEKSKGLWDN